MKKRKIDLRLEEDLVSNVDHAAKMLKTTGLTSSKLPCERT